MKVSVIVPVYNSEKYLRTCLNSLVNQTLKDIEIIIIDDASTDKSLEIIKEFVTLYPNKIKVIVNNKNLGTSASRNKGMLISKGEYIGFVDSDDFVLPNHFELMYKNAKSSKFPEISSCGFIILNRKNFTIKNASLNSREIHKLNENPSFILTQSQGVWDKIFLQDFIKDKKFLENSIWEDIAFSYGALIQAKRLVSSYNVTYFYRRNPNGISASCNKVNPKLLDIFGVLDDLERQVNECNDFERYLSVLKNLQIKHSLNRIRDVKRWNIPLEEKRNLMILLADLIAIKYDGERKEQTFLQTFLELQASSMCSPINYDTSEEEITKEIEQHLKLLKK